MKCTLIDLKNYFTMFVLTFLLQDEFSHAMFYDLFLEFVVNNFTCGQ